jgi:carboxypeptidase Taq
VAAQQDFNREVAEALGFRFSAGRIDSSAHPFCTTLGPSDIRLTTRYDEADFTSSLFGVMHEVGHGLYEQGLADDDFGTPAGESVSLGIHESQSRLWENHIGRSRAFWEKWYPRAQAHFPCLASLPLDAFMRHVLRSEFSFIRVEADEATYDLHILLRFDLERQLVNGSLAVADVPDAWNEAFGALSGLRPPDDRRGCLQDIHWSMGGLGYFPTYTLGNLHAAQLFAASQAVPEIADSVKKADYAALLDWLQKHVHCHGATIEPAEIIRLATGREPSAEAHLQHLRNRYLT